MPIVRVTTNYQVTIPIEVRKALNVNTGDYVEVTVSEDGVVLLKPVEIVEKKSRRKKENRKEEAWQRLGEEAMLAQYDEEDAAYDMVKL